MNTADSKAPEITDWHAHVYFDAATRDPAWALRERIEKEFEIQMGRFHERPVGPHPMFSYQVTVRNEQIGPFISWLALNHGDLIAFIHPNTGQDLEDHRDRAVWIGKSVPLVLDIFTKKKD
jgi:DOPA 4,5-dioxygenase